MTRTVTLLLILLIGAPVFGATIDFSAITTTGGLLSGFDPFFWANVPLAAAGQIDSAAPATNCGADCATYSATLMNLLVNNSLLYAVTTPGVTVVVPAAGSSLYQLSGLINVAPYTVAFALSIFFPQGVLTAGALSAPPEFAPTLIDAQNSTFTYTIIAGGPPISGTLGMTNGIAAAASGVPEPATFALFGGGLIALAGLARVRARIR